MNCLTQHLTIVWEKGYTIMGIWVSDWGSFIGGVATTLLIVGLSFLIADWSMLSSRERSRARRRNNR